MAKSVPADGEKILRLRAAAGLTQKELAAATRRLAKEAKKPFGVDLRTIVTAESGENVSPVTLANLARVLLGDAKSWEKLQRSGILIPERAASEGESVGHSVKLYSVAIRVEPRELKEHGVMFGDNTKKMVLCDNVAKFEYRTEFHRDNRYDSAFVCQYCTLGGGCIEVLDQSDPNEYLPQERRAYNTDGHHYVYRFRPRVGREFRLALQVYKGFDEGNRDVHFHLLKPAFYHVVKVSLDLSAYVEEGYKVDEPVLHFHADDSQDCKHFCGRGGRGHPLESKDCRVQGLWVWERRNLNQGIFHINMDWRKSY